MSLEFYGGWFKRIPKSITLEEISENFLDHTYVGITIAYPQRGGKVPFGYQCAVTQVNTLEDHIDRLYSKIRQCRIDLQRIEHRVELCKNGTPHVHALLEIKGLIPEAAIPHLVLDIAKSIYKTRENQFAKYVRFNCDNFYSKYNRFRSPFTCVQYYGSRHDTICWKEYINKMTDIKIIKRSL